MLTLKHWIQEISNRANNHQVKQIVKHYYITTSSNLMNTTIPTVNGELNDN